ncbi:MAG: two-component system LytT family response regulator [Paraglaciecola sp.]|jgi:two-component system LytT family response regulator
MPTAIIIDDIPTAIDNLKRDLAIYCPDIEVIATASGVVTGAKLLKKATSDLLFLDIQMQDGSGFDLLEILPKINFKLIFTTASDAFAIRAFKFSAIDYLLKPIDPDELTVAVKKATNQLSESAENVNALLENVKDKNAPTRMALHTLEKIHVAEIKEILRLESTGNYTQFFFLDGTKLLVTKTLKEFDKLLADNGFIRIHQSHLINLKQIKEYVKVDGGYIVMKGGSKVPVSVRKRPLVVKALEQPF